MRRNPLPSSQAALKRMKAVRQRDTAPEVAIRRAIFRRGYRFRIQVRPLGGLNRRADVVFPTEKVAVFVDGCFWHCCPLHGTSAKANAEFWAEKLETNRKRDTETDDLLRSEGWLPVRIWEHEDPEEAAEKVCGLVLARRNAGTTGVPLLDAG